MTVKRHLWPFFTDQEASACYRSYMDTATTVRLKTGVKLCIAGSRHIPEWLARRLIRRYWPRVLAHLESCGLEAPRFIVCGGARGVDTAAETLAKMLTGRKPIVFCAQWDQHGKAAGPIRNTMMAEVADALLLIWDGKSRGSRHMLGMVRDGWKKPYVELIVELPKKRRIRMPKTLRQALDPEALRELVEDYAVGDYNRLFDVAWTDVEEFIKTAKDYVRKSAHAKFEREVRTHFNRGASDAR